MKIQIQINWAGQSIGVYDNSAALGRRWNQNVNHWVAHSVSEWVTSHILSCPGQLNYWSFERGWFLYKYCEGNSQSEINRIFIRSHFERLYSIEGATWAQHSKFKSTLLQIYCLAWLFGNSLMHKFASKQFTIPVNWLVLITWCELAEF